MAYVFKNCLLLYYWHCGLSMTSFLFSGGEGITIEPLIGLLTFLNAI